MTDSGQSAPARTFTPERLATPIAVAARFLDANLNTDPEACPGVTCGQCAKVCMCRPCACQRCRTRHAKAHRNTPPPLRRAVDVPLSERLFDVPPVKARRR